MGTIRERAIKWYHDRKLIIAFVIIAVSFVLGIYSKAIIITKFYKPIYLITGLSVWAFSWVLLFLGIFLVGWETVKMMQQRIHHHVRKTVKETYHYTRGLPKKGYKYTKKLHKKLTK